MPNQDSTRRSGLLANVTFHVPRKDPGVVIPDEAMVFDQTGLHVLVVRKADTVKSVPINIYRSFGTFTELRGRLTGDGNLLMNLPADISDGSKVKLGDDGKAG